MEFATRNPYSSSSYEFDFNSGRASPCGSSPSTPRGFGAYYFSAPTSPVPPSAMFNRDVEGFSYGTSTYATGLFATTPESSSPEHYSFKVEEMINSNNKPTIKGSGKHKKIETIKSPLLYPQSPISTKNHHNKKSFWSTFSPRRKKEPDNTESTTSDNSRETRTKQRSHNKGYERRVARSLSPPRDPLWEEEDHQDQQSSSSNNNNPPLSTPSSSGLPPLSSSKGSSSRKWRFKDLLLFRSASEGRASEKDLLKKYSYLHWKQHHHEQGLNNNNNNNNNVVPKKKGHVSAHEVHYTVNKAISDDMKKKSFLPYKQGILGRLAINPTVHALAHGFGSLA